MAPKWAIILLNATSYLALQNKNSQMLIKSIQIFGFRLVKSIHAERIVLFWAIGLLHLNWQVYC